MPSAEAILAGLTRIANDAFLLAVVWHVVVALLLVFFAVRGPLPRVGAVLASAPLASVSALAWSFGNPFNGAMFAVLAASLAILAGLRHGPDAARPTWARVAGGVMIAYAWVYPHFLESGGLAYLIGSPMGLVPCPTLALLLGLALVGVVRARRAWSFVLAGAGLLYATIGVLRLGVVLDVPLFLGAIALVFVDARAPRPVASLREATAR